MTITHVWHGPLQAPRATATTCWCRPDDYLEDSEHLASWEGLYRWVAYHRVLGSYLSGSFIAGDDFGDITTAYGMTGTVACKVKLVPVTLWQHGGTYLVNVTLPDATTAAWQVRVPSAGDDPVFVRPGSVLSAETADWAGGGLVASVNSVQLVSGTGEDLYAVVDCPVVATGGPVLTNAAYTPYALVFGLAGKGCRMVTLETGVTWVAWEEDGVVYAREKTGSPATWGGTLRTVDSSDTYESPDIAGTAALLEVCALNKATGKCVHWYSRDYGATWEGPALVGA